MDPNALADIDRQIAQLKKELNALFSKRIAILHDEIKRSEAEAMALNPGSTLSPFSLVKVKRPRQPKPVPALEEPSPVPESAVPEPVASTPASAPEEKPEPQTRRRVSSSEAETPVLEALKEAGLFGLTQAEISKKTGLGAQAVAKKLKDLPGITKKGAGREARFYLKS